MHLRVVDKSDNEAVDDLVEVELTSSEGRWSHCAEYFPSELTANFASY